MSLHMHYLKERAGTVATLRRLRWKATRRRFEEEVMLVMRLPDIEKAYKKMAHCYVAAANEKEEVCKRTLAAARPWDIVAKKKKI